jgi:hypothetical protein
VNQTLLHAAGASPLRPSENPNKNLSKKEKQEAFCAFRWSGPGRTRQKETEQNSPELAPTRQNNFMFWARRRWPVLK